MDNGTIGRFWYYWNQNKMRTKFCERYAKGEGHDLCCSSPTEKTDEFYYTIGFIYSDSENADGFNIIDVPGGTYIIFDIPKEYANDVGTFMGHCMAEYIPAAGYKLSGVDVEYFPNSCKNEAWFLVADSLH